GRAVVVDLDLVAERVAVRAHRPARLDPQLIGEAALAALVARPQPHLHRGVRDLVVVGEDGSVDDAQPHGRPDCCCCCCWGAKEGRPGMRGRSSRRKKDRASVFSASHARERKECRKRSSPWSSSSSTEANSSWALRPPSSRSGWRPAWFCSAIRRPSWV